MDHVSSGERSRILRVAAGKPARPRRVAVDRLPSRRRTADARSGPAHGTHGTRIRCPCRRATARRSAPPASSRPQRQRESRRGAGAGRALTGVPTDVGPLQVAADAPDRRSRGRLRARAAGHRRPAAERAGEAGDGDLHFACWRSRRTPIRSVTHRRCLPVSRRPPPRAGTTRRLGCTWAQPRSRSVPSTSATRCSARRRKGCARTVASGTRHTCSRSGGGDLLLAQPDPGASTARCCVRLGPSSRER
jgi:hypothetical protein